MKVETYIRNYAKRNTEPDQKYCPDLYIYWGRKSGEVEYNPKTGEIKPKEKNRYNHSTAKYYLSARSYGCYGAYAKIIKNGEILELAFIKLKDMSRAKDGEVRKWCYYDTYHKFNRIFLVKETGELYNEDGTVFKPEANGRYYNNEFVAGVYEMSHAKYVGTENFYEELVTFVFGHKDKERLWLYKFVDWYKNIKPRTTKANEIIEKELSPFSGDYYNVTFEIINEDYAVFRLCAYNYDDTIAGENRRVFIRKDGKVTVAVRKGNKWVVSPKASVADWNYKKKVTHLKAEELKEFEGLKYVADIVIDRYCDAYTVDNVIATLRHPIIESLSKAGYPMLARYVSRENYIKSNIKDIFDVDLKSERGELTKLLNVNKYLLKEVENSITYSDCGRTYYCSPVGLMRSLFGDKLKSFNEEDIKIYYEACHTIKNKCGYTNIGYYLIPDDEARWGGRWGEISHINKEKLEYIKKLICKIAKLGSEPLELYMDAINTYKHLYTINKPDIDWFAFKRKEDIELLHENLVEMLNVQHENERFRYNEELKMAYEKKQKQRIERFEDRESDDTYMIIVPRHTSELVTEGQMLNHCVGGYVSNYERGYTNIVFLRKKAEPNMPFYTIEINNDGYIPQIHGKHNRWLGNDPEAIAYVYKWIKECQLYCEDYKLLDKASGYSRSGDEVSRDYLNDNTVYQIRFA